MRESVSNERSAPDPMPPLNRWLVVGDGQWVQQVRRAILPFIDQTTIAHVSGFFGAIGELAVRPAEVVIGPLEAADGMVESLARSLRKVAPHARLLVVAPANQRCAAEAAKFPA